MRALLYPGVKQVVFRKTYTDCANSLWLETMTPLLEALGSQYVRIYKHSAAAEFSNGSLIRIGGLHPGEIDKALGVEYGTIYVNEASEVHWRNVPVLETRLNDRSVNMHTKQVIVPKIIFDCNPPTSRHWLYSLFIRKVSPETGEPLKEPDKYVSLQMNPEDNKENLAAGLLDTLRSMSPANRKRFLHGEFGQLSGLVYDNFDPEVNVIDDIVGKEFDEWLKKGRIFRSIDFGFVHPFVCLWGHLASDDTLTIFKERSVAGVTIDIHAREIIAESAGMKIEATCCDHDAGERALLEKYGIRSVPAQKNVRAGINACHTLIGLGKIKIFRSCTKLIDSFYSYQWKDKTVKEEPVKEDDDEQDALRYLVQTFLSRGPAITAKPVAWL
jgi:phage terminase large subunit